MKTTSLLLSCLIFSFLFQFCSPQALAVIKKYEFEPEKAIVVAVIDTGADIHHAMIKNHLWTNPDFDPKSGKDDLHGWNFVDNNSNLQDSHGHGTHIAGIIAQNKKIKLMILKAFDLNQTGQAAIDSTVSAIHYAIQHQAQIINYSGGGTTSHPRELRALELAQKKGIFVVAAAGNLKSNSDDWGFYPANYHLANIVSVAAVDQSDHLLNSSNYGKKTVTVAALGKEVISATPNNHFAKMTGTSQATAKVTRVLANYIGQDQNPVHAMVQSARRSDLLIQKIKNPVIIEDFKK